MRVRPAYKGFARAEEVSMFPRRLARAWAICACAALLAAGPAGAVEVTNLEGLEELFGRYAPGGDCQRQPRILVERAGMTFEVGGATERVTRMEYAAGYGGNFYEGISEWVFPFGRDGSYPILMAFNADEKPGVLTIAGHDEGWKGGPKLAPRNQALVSGSPYAKCK